MMIDNIERWNRGIMMKNQIIKKQIQINIKINKINKMKIKPKRDGGQ